MAQTQERQGPSRTKEWQTSTQRVSNEHLMTFNEKCENIKLFHIDVQRVCVISLTVRLVRATDARKVCVHRLVTVKGM